VAALSGKTILVTRASDQARELRERLAALGANVYEVPTLVIVPVRGDELMALDAALRELCAGAFDAVLVTSANSVVFVCERAVQLGLWERAQGARFYAVGPATAQALVARGVVAPILADEAIGESLVRKVTETLGESLTGKRLLLPRAREGRRELVTELAAHGARLDVVTVYDTVPVTGGPGLPTTPADWVTFASPSAVKAFVGRFGRPLAKVACIGPVTAKAAESLGLVVAAMARDHTSAGLVEAIVAAQG